MAIEVLSVREASQRLRLRPETVRLWARQRRFLWYKLGSRMVIDAGDLERFLREQAL
jgi:excisionase family DNA binding protein